MEARNDDKIVEYFSIERETEAAYLIKFEAESAPVWLPKSQVDIDTDAKTAVMPNWLYIKHF